MYEPLSNATSLRGHAVKQSTTSITAHQRNKLIGTLLTCTPFHTRKSEFRTCSLWSTTTQWTARRLRVFGWRLAACKNRTTFDFRFDQVDQLTKNRLLCGPERQYCRTANHRHKTLVQNHGGRLPAQQKLGHNSNFCCPIVTWCVAVCFLFVFRVSFLPCAYSCLHVHMSVTTCTSTLVCWAVFGSPYTRFVWQVSFFLRL